MSHAQSTCDAAKVFYSKDIPVIKEELVKKCAATMKFPLLTGKWCASSIMEYEWLENYYIQFLMEKYVANYATLVLPNVITVNDLGANGTIRIDERRSYSLVDTALLATVHSACTHTGSAICASLEAALLARRSAHPLQLWDDADRGRKKQLPT